MAGKALRCERLKLTCNVALELGSPEDHGLQSFLRDGSFFAYRTRKFLGDPPAAPTLALNYLQKRAIVNIVPSIPRRTIPVDQGTWVAVGG